MLDAEQVWRHHRLAIGVWDLGSFRRPPKTNHYYSVATTGPTTRDAIATRSNALREDIDAVDVTMDMQDSRQSVV